MRSINQPTGRLINFLRICGGTGVNEGHRGAIEWRKCGFARGSGVFCGTMPAFR
ncbi:Lysophospholipase L1-related protein [Burkholderia anthina]|nr:Lysophospholipase L1-related protein [Burkholderia anthina]